MREPDSNRMWGSVGGDAVESVGSAGSEAPREDAREAILLPRGLPGFPDARRCRLAPLRHCEGRFLRLELAGEEALSLIVMPVDPETMPLARADIAEVCRGLEISREDLCLLLVVTLVREGGEWQAYVNLRAPIFLDTRRRFAAQMVLSESGYPLRHPLQRSAA